MFAETRIKYEHVLSHLRILLWPESDLDWSKEQNKTQSCSCCEAGSGVNC